MDYNSAMAPKSLVVVESPNKISKIQSFLGSSYIVRASCGIILDLDPKSMSIEFDNNFEPIYQISKTNIVSDLRASYKLADELIIATDDDREGEMIGWTIAHILKVKNPKRIIFRSITKNDILNAIKKPTIINDDMVNAQKARRVLDRIVGYKLSPLLTNICPGKLSAGRVQSVVVKIIIDRENEIKDILTSDLGSFYRGTGIFVTDIEYKTSLHDLKAIDDGIFKGDLTKFANKGNVKKFFSKAFKSKYMVTGIYCKDRFQNSPPPFETVTLQQESSTKLRFSTKKTMDVAQRLYEAGLITYMRTDSTVLADEAMQKIQKYVINTHGKDYYKKSVYKTKSKNAQEAHEAIRPTNIETLQAKGNKIGTDEMRLYALIWKRTLASQMMPAKFKVTNMQISIIGDIDHFYLNTSEQLSFDGYLVVYGIVPEVSSLEYPSVGSYVDPKSIVCEEDCKKPPVRFTDASLVKKMGPHGLNIGRPSTYASIIDKIKMRGYVEINTVDGLKKDMNIFSWDGKSGFNLKEKTKTISIGKDSNKYCPTVIGIETNTFLLKNFPKIMDHKFTAEMENGLDRIAKGKLVWNKLIGDFYVDFAPCVEKCKKELPKTNFTEKFSRELSDTIMATITKHGPAIKHTSEAGDIRYVNIEKPLSYEKITLEEATTLLEYPKLLGKYNNLPVYIKKGRFGYYIDHGKSRKSVESDITLDEAIILLEKSEKSNLSLASFTDKKFEYNILKGIYGKYIRVKSLKPTKKEIKTNSTCRNIRLPGKTVIEDLTLTMVQDIVGKKKLVN